MSCFMFVYGQLGKSLHIIWKELLNVYLLMTELDCLELTFCGWQDVKIQLFLKNIPVTISGQRKDIPLHSAIVYHVWEATRSTMRALAANLLLFCRKLDHTFIVTLTAKQKVLQNNSSQFILYVCVCVCVCVYVCVCVCVCVFHKLTQTPKLNQVSKPHSWAKTNYTEMITLFLQKQRSSAPSQAYH